MDSYTKQIYPRFARSAPPPPPMSLSSIAPPLLPQFEVATEIQEAYDPGLR
jgi:hypothetical protein